MRQNFQRVLKLLIRVRKQMISCLTMIIIGILGAFALSNWNEGRKSEIQGNNYKAKLIADIIIDTNNIDSLIQSSELFQNNIGSYFDYFDQGDNSVNDLIDSCAKVQWRYFRYQPVNQTLTSLKSTGDIRLLSEEQRNSLVRLADTQELLNIVIGTKIYDIKFMQLERNKYLDLDPSESNFFEIVKSKQPEESLIKGLLQQHYIFKEVLANTKTMINMGNRIKEESKKCLELLTEQ